MKFVGILAVLAMAALVADDEDAPELEGVPSGPFQSFVEVPIPSAQDGSIHTILAYVSPSEQAEWIEKQARLVT